MPTITTPNMSLILPVVSAELGPAWATELNTAIGSGIDGHDHSDGKGVKITPAGMDITSALSFVGHDATNLRSTRFSSQGAALAGVADKGCVYVVGNDLWFNDEAGNQIQLTAGGTINSAGLVSSVWATQTVSTNISIAPSNTKITFLVDTSGFRVISLPLASAVAAGRFYVFVDSSGFSDSLFITLTPAGSDTIDGASGDTHLAAIHGSWILISDGVSNWHLHRSGSELNGATVPVAGALTTGNTLQVTGSKALGYGPLNLAGGTNFVFGVLPANQLGVATTVQSGAVQLTHDLSGTATSPTVIGVSATAANPFTLGTAGPANITWGCDSLLWKATASAPQLGVTARASTGSPVRAKFYGQDAFSGGGATAAAGGGVDYVSGSSFGASAGDANVSGDHKFKVGPNTLMHLSEVVTSRSVVALGNSVSSSDVSDGNRFVWIANANVVPTAPSSTGAILYSNAGSLGILAAGGDVIEIPGTSTNLFVNGGGIVLTAPDDWLYINHNGVLKRIPLFP